MLLHLRGARAQDALVLKVRPCMVSSATSCCGWLQEHKSARLQALHVDHQRRGSSGLQRDCVLKWHTQPRTSLLKKWLSCSLLETSQNQSRGAAATQQAARYSVRPVTEMLRRYCTAGCQKRDWAGHKAHCKVYRESGETMVREPGKTALFHQKFFRYILRVRPSSRNENCKCCKHAPCLWSLNLLLDRSRSTAPCNAHALGRCAVCPVCNAASLRACSACAACYPESAPFTSSSLQTRIVSADAP